MYSVHSTGLQLFPREVDTYAAKFNPSCNIMNHQENLDGTLTIFNFGLYSSSRFTDANINYICYNQDGVEVRFQKNTLCIMHLVNCCIAELFL